MPPGSQTRAGFDTHTNSPAYLDGENPNINNLNFCKMKDSSKQLIELALENAKKYTANSEIVKAANTKLANSLFDDSTTTPVGVECTIVDIDDTKVNMNGDNYIALKLQYEADGKTITRFKSLGSLTGSAYWSANGKDDGIPYRSEVTDADGNETAIPANVLELIGKCVIFTLAEKKGFDSVGPIWNRTLPGREAGKLGNFELADEHTVCSVLMSSRGKRYAAAPRKVYHLQFLN